MGIRSPWGDAFFLRLSLKPLRNCQIARYGFLLLRLFAEDYVYDNADVPHTIK